TTMTSRLVMTIPPAVSTTLRARRDRRRSAVQAPGCENPLLQIDPTPPESASSTDSCAPKSQATKADQPDPPWCWRRLALQPPRIMECSTWNVPSPAGEPRLLESSLRPRYPWRVAGQLHPPHYSSWKVFCVRAQQIEALTASDDFS